MKTILAALTSACLLAAPIALSATGALAHGGGGHGVGGHGGGFSGGFHGGGFHGGGFRGGGFGGGFRGDGFSHGGTGGRGLSDGGFGGRGFDHRDGRHEFGGRGFDHGDGRHDRDGFRGRGFFGDDDLFDFGFGFYGDPFFYGDPGFYGYLDYNWAYGPYGYGPPYPYDDAIGAPPASYQSSPSGSQAGPPPCGHWVWDATQSVYNWAAC